MVAFQRATFTTALTLAVCFQRRSGLTFDDRLLDLLKNVF
jgi:hypothetical protein